MQDSFDLVVFTDAPLVQRTGLAAAPPATLRRRAAAYVPTPEDIAKVVTLYDAGASKLEICQAMGWKSYRWEALRAPGGPLNCLPPRRGQTGGRFPRIRGSRIGDEPTPEQIASIEQRKLEVRSRWTPEEELLRRGLPIDTPACPFYADAPPRGVFSLYSP
jgi:hypothetical protein